MSVNPSHDATDVKAVHWTAPVEWIEANAGKPKRFAMRAYGGGIMRVEGFNLRIVVDLAGLDAKQQRRPILRDHDRAAIVGHSERIRVDKAIHADGVVSEVGDVAAEVTRRAQEGFPWQASIGASVDTIENVKAGTNVTVNGQTFAGPIIVARKSMLREISFVTQGADDSTWASIAARKENKMPTELTGAAVDAERISTIRAKAGEKHATLGLKALAEGWSVDRLELECLKADSNAKELERIDASRAKTPGIIAGNSSGVADKDALAAGLLLYAGKESVAAKVYSARTMEAAKGLRIRTLMDAVKAALYIDGMDEPTGGKDAMIRAGFSTYSLPVALGDSMHKTLVEMFKEYQTPWRSVCDKKTTADFKANCAIRPGAIDALDRLGAGGEIKHTTIGEDVFTYSVMTYARMIQITRQSIINDDAGFWDSLPRGFAKASHNAVNDRFATVFMNNASHFTTARGNYFEGAATNLQASSLATAIKMLRLMTDDKGKPIDMTPATLLVPPTLESSARALLSSEFLQQTVAGLPTGNPYREAVKMEVEPRLENSSFTGNSTTAWYLFASAVEMPVIAAFLDGKDEPVIEQEQAPFNVLGLQWRSYIDFDFALGEYRAAVKSKVAA